MRRACLVIATVLCLSIEGGAALAAEPEAEGASPATGSRIAAGFWVNGAGDVDRGISYDVLSFRSPLRAGMAWRVSLLLGSKTGGVSVATDLWRESTRLGETRLSLGGAALAPDIAVEGWTPAAVILLRITKPE